MQPLNKIIAFLLFLLLFHLVQCRRSNNVSGVGDSSSYSYTYGVGGSGGGSGEAAGYVTVVRYERHKSAAAAAAAVGRLPAYAYQVPHDSTPRQLHPSGRQYGQEVGLSGGEGGGDGVPQRGCYHHPGPSSGRQRSQTAPSNSYFSHADENHNSVYGGGGSGGGSGSGSGIPSFLHFPYRGVPRMLA